jgi:hypothetical protein
MSDRIALARAIAARTKPRFIEISREPGGGEGALHRGTANGYGWWPGFREISALPHPQVWEVKLEAAGPEK